MVNAEGMRTSKWVGERWGYGASYGADKRGEKVCTVSVGQ